MIVLYVGVVKGIIARQELVITMSEEDGCQYMCA